MTRREEYNLSFNKVKSSGWSTYYVCEGNSQDGRSLFVATILRGHDDIVTVEAFLEEITFAENGQFQDIDEFWQPDSLTDGFRCFITPPEIKLGKDYDYVVPLQGFKELLQEWLEFLQD